MDYFYLEILFLKKDEKEEECFERFISTGTFMKLGKLLNEFEKKTLQ